MQFNVRDVLWLTAVIACLVCWYMEREGRLESSRRYVVTFEARKRLEEELAESRAEQVRLKRILSERYAELQRNLEALRK